MDANALKQHIYDVTEVEAFLQEASGEAFSEALHDLYVSWL